MGHPRMLLRADAVCGLHISRILMPFYLFVLITGLSGFCPDNPIIKTDSFLPHVGHGMKLQDVGTLNIDVRRVTDFHSLPNSTLCSLCQSRKAQIPVSELLVWVPLSLTSFLCHWKFICFPTGVGFVNDLQLFNEENSAEITDCADYQAT